MDMPFALNSLESKTDRYWEKSSMSRLMRSALFELMCFEGETYCSNLNSVVKSKGRYD